MSHDPTSIPLSGNFPVLQVGQRMKCSACGSRKIGTAPQLGQSTLEQARQRRREL